MATTPFPRLENTFSTPPAATGLRKNFPETAESESSAFRGANLGYTTTVTTMEQTERNLAGEPISSSPSAPHMYQDCPGDEIVLRTRRRLKVRDIRLKTFNKEIEEPIRQRFCDLMELYETPLDDYLSKGESKIGTISIKLKILGESEETAKPWIVILCHKAMLKRVKKFFNQPAVKQEYQPPNSVTDLPTFELLVRDRPPRLNVTLTHIDLYGQSWGNKDTLCGELIGVNEDGQIRKATIGGIVGMTSPAGLRIYGMTVGHIAVKEPPRGEKLNLEELDESEGEDEEGVGGKYLLDEELDDAALEDQATREEDPGPAHYSAAWSKIGRISVPTCEERMSNLDWALVELDNPLDYRPNLLRTPSSRDPPPVLLHLEDQPSLETGGSHREVLVLTGTKGPRSGTLSISPSFFMLSPGRRFAETYNLTLRDGLGLNPGDSGSWVVDPLRFQVYGHVVASDIFREIYVVPLHSTFQQMETMLEAYVSLPTPTELGNWQHTFGASGNVPFSSQYLPACHKGFISNFILSEHRYWAHIAR
ncbi:MAG: hypothetical protein M1839_005697 [Geoglossum umbratile]|nr:MAG: hypothetical protein M1839_005697 [Geoglossum umbratile]